MIEQAMQQGAPPDPAEDPVQGERGAPPAADSKGAPNPQALEAFKHIIAAAGKVIYHKEISAQLLRMVQSAEDPVAGAAQATLTVLEQIKTQVKGVHPNFVYTAAPAVASMLLELAGAAKLVKFDEETISQVTQAIVETLKSRGAAGEQAGTPAAAPAQGAPPAQPQPQAAQANGQTTALPNG